MSQNGPEVIQFWSVVSEAAMDDDDNDMDYTPPSEQTQNSLGTRTSTRKRKVTYKLKQEMMTRRPKAKPPSVGRAADKKPKHVTRAASQRGEVAAESTPSPDGAEEGKKVLRSKVLKTPDGKKTELAKMSSNVETSLGQVCCLVVHFIL